LSSFFKSREKQCLEIAKWSPQNKSPIYGIIKNISAAETIIA
jgi:hypothetical protein